MIGIIDYGMSNLHSVKNACDYLNLDSVVSKDVSVLSKCDKLILPGVGAFQDCMNTFHGIIRFCCSTSEKRCSFIRNLFRNASLV